MLTMEGASSTLAVQQVALESRRRTADTAVVEITVQHSVSRMIHDPDCGFLVWPHVFVTGSEPTEEPLQEKIGGSPHLQEYDFKLTSAGWSPK